MQTRFDFDGDQHLTSNDAAWAAFYRGLKELRGNRLDLDVLRAFHVAAEHLVSELQADQPIEWKGGAWTIERSPDRLSLYLVPRDANARTIAKIEAPGHPDLWVLVLPCELVQRYRDGDIRPAHDVRTRIESAAEAFERATAEALVRIETPERTRRRASPSRHRIARVH